MKIEGITGSKAEPNRRPGDIERQKKQKQNGAGAFGDILEKKIKRK